MSRRGGDFYYKFRQNRGETSSSSWSNTGFKRPKPPHGLRGREIGLYYRNLHMRDKKLNKTRAITLRIPKPVIVRLKNNLQSIAKAAVKENITINPKSISILTKDEQPDDVKEVAKGIDMIKTKEMSRPSYTTCCGTSIDGATTSRSFNSDDFIPMPEPDIDYGVDNRLLSLRSTKDFKYGYEDIITGTFSEKLEECLSKGININYDDNDTKSLNVAFYDEFKIMISKSQYQKMLKFRQTLPTYKKREELLNFINNNQVVVISGETGCGKSTQVPQLILDEAIQNKKGAHVKILITQPRRIAASSLAERVANERAESVGNAVGYAVRLDKKEPRTRGSMMFCTTGVLLVDLEVNQGLTDYSHVILDEVHERDCHIDFAMCMLKQVLQKRKDLKLILMSATLDADKLSAYFDNCPVMHIEGFAYYVKDIYLEEILQMTGFQLQPYIEPRPRKPYHRFRGRFKEDSVDIKKETKYRAEIDPWLQSVKNNLYHSVYHTLQDYRIEELNIDLIFALLKYVCRGPPGAILVFVPGIGEITKLLTLISTNESYLGSKCVVYALHSKLPSLEQHKIFERPPENERKIVVATNIAETSITIDDIVYVIDSGKIKYNGLNVEDYVSTLKTEWVSQANLRQRRGRAGRCQPGVCYHLMTSYRASVLDERLLPELQRNNLLEPILTIKRLRLGKVADAFKNVMDSPAENTIERAITHLQQCGALDDNELLTPLGWHLARLPLHPTAGKLVLLGALFGCLDRAVSVAAVWSFKDPFLLVIDKETEIKAAKRAFSLSEPSDHIAISEAIIQWQRSTRRRDFAYRNFLSANTLELLCEMKQHIGNNLNQMGFLNSNDITSSWENRNSNNLSLFKAIVAASLYPNIGTARWTNINCRNPNKQMRVKARIPEGVVQIHPSSIMMPPKFSKGAVRLCSNPGANWLVYWLKQKSSDLFLFEITMVYTLPLLFFGELKVSEAEDDPASCHVSISSYKVQMLKETAEHLLQLRNLLDQVLASKIMVASNHSIRHCPFEEQVLNAVVEVITAEDERVEYLEDNTDSDNSECD